MKYKLFRPNNIPVTRLLCNILKIRILIKGLAYKNNLFFVDRFMFLFNYIFLLNTEIHFSIDNT